MRLWPVVALGTFQSTSPVRGTTVGLTVERNGLTISIHVPREGDDGKTHTFFCLAADFNPRPP